MARRLLRLHVGLAFERRRDTLQQLRTPRVDTKAKCRADLGEAGEARRAHGGVMAARSDEEGMHRGVGMRWQRLAQTKHGLAGGRMGGFDAVSDMWEG